MNKSNIDYILDIFRTLSTEVPEHMLYRESGDSIELRTPDNSVSQELQNNGWRLIGCQMIEAA